MSSNIKIEINKKTYSRLFELLIKKHFLNIKNYNCEEENIYIELPYKIKNDTIYKRLNEVNHLYKIRENKWSDLTSDDEAELNTMLLKVNTHR